MRVGDTVIYQGGSNEQVVRDSFEVGEELRVVNVDEGWLDCEPVAGGDSWWVEVSCLTLPVPVPERRPEQTYGLDMYVTTPEREPEVGDTVIYDGNSSCDIVQRHWQAGDRLTIHSIQTWLSPDSRLYYCSRVGEDRRLYVAQRCCSLAPDEDRPFREGDRVLLTQHWQHEAGVLTAPGAVPEYITPNETVLQLLRPTSNHTEPHWWVRDEHRGNTWVIPEQFLRHVDSPAQPAPPPPARVKVYDTASIPGYCGGIDISTTECFPRYVDRISDAVELEDGGLFNVESDLLNRRTILVRDQERLNAVLYAMEYHGIECSVFQQGKRFPAVVIPDDIRRDLSGDLDRLDEADSSIAGTYRSLENQTISYMRVLRGSTMPVSLFDHDKLDRLHILLNSSWCREPGVTGYSSGQALGSWLREVLKKVDDTTSLDPIRLCVEPRPIYLHVLATMTNPSESRMPAIALAFSNTDTPFTETEH